jgi:hypothetical protein
MLSEEIVAVWLRSILISPLVVTRHMSIAPGPASVGVM